VGFIARALGRDVAKAVLLEAIAEAQGKSDRKWALLVLAFLAGTLVAVIVLVVVQTILYRTLSAYTFWCVVLLLMRDRHPRLADETTPLDRGRRLGVALLLLLFVVSFIPVPLSL